MIKEQIFQLKLAASDLAVRAGATVGANNVVTAAQEIYNFLTAEATAPKTEKVLGLVKPSVADIQELLPRD